MTISMPATVKSFGNESLQVLTTVPAALDGVILAEITASDNITCHVVGDWYASAETNKVARQRKMCQTKVTEALGVSTWQTPDLMYTYLPQSVGTPATAGNEAYEALVEGATVYLLQRLGKGGKTAITTGDEYLLWPVELGPQVPGPSADDEGGEFIMTQACAFAPGYDEPISGTVAAA